MWQINKAVSEHKKLVETCGRLQRMLPDKDAFVDNLTKARQAAHEVRTVQIAFVNARINCKKTYKVLGC